ncbi:hypothetical protein RA210_U340002 [Rubrivivax sp. A210]|nr:hypothetical protein RA210_U340002 [Rubrivivax sp. A210]
MACVMRLRDGRGASVGSSHPAVPSVEHQQGFWDYLAGTWRLDRPTLDRRKPRPLQAARASFSLERVAC